jgi:hypothetical protein
MKMTNYGPPEGSGGKLKPFIYFYLFDLFYISFKIIYKICLIIFKNYTQIETHRI